MRSLPVVLAITLLSGCIFNFGSCYSVDSVGWQDPTLPDRLRELGPAWTVTQANPSGPGLPFQNNSVEQAYGISLLTTVALVPTMPYPGYHQQLILYPDVLHGRFDERNPETAVRAAARTMLANVTDDANVEELVDQFIASGQQDSEGPVYSRDRQQTGYHYISYQIPTPESLHLETLWSSLRHNATEPVTARDLGPWIFSFEAAVYQADRGGLTLKVTHLGAATWTDDLLGRSQHDEAARQRFQETWPPELGSVPPYFELDATIC